MSQKFSVALAGNPNAGKTTMFNGFTGARQHVGNYPGITVDKKEGYASHNGDEFHIIDLPGTYSLTAYTQEELVARNVLIDERPDAAIAVVNAGALERNLYLVVQLLELGVPTAIALNMMDEAQKMGMRIDSRKLADLIGCPVVETIARAKKGLDQVLGETAEHAARHAGAPWRPLNISYGPDLDPVLQSMTDLIRDEQFLTDKYPARWLALKYLENDDEIKAVGAAAGPVSKKLEAMVSELAEHCQATLNTYPEALIADYRYGFIASLLKQGVLTRESLSARIDLSDRMDQVLTHRVFGPMIMLGVLMLVYQITFTIGEVPLGWMEALFGFLGDSVESLLPAGLLRSLLVSGIIDGVGGVMVFVPLILIIFFLISFLEDSGYMARIAYMLDRVFRMFGLHGSSVMPFIVSGGISGGCAVPGVLASRTLRSPREKLATLLTAPFMTCGAKLPVFILLVGVFFPEHRALALFFITLVAWGTALVVARILRSTIIRGPSTPFVMELPPYRLPTMRGMLIHTWERTWQYIKKAGTVILAISVLLWASMTFPQPPEEAQQHFAQTRATLEQEIQTLQAENAPPEQIAERREMLATLSGKEDEGTLRNSLAGRMGSALEGVSSLAGFDWRTNIALIGGFTAKEVIISTLATAYSLGEVDEENPVSLSERIASDPMWSTARGVALIIFILLYAPCFVTVIAIKQETGGWKWPIFSMIFNTALAYGLAVAIFQSGRFLAF